MIPVLYNANETNFSSFGICKIADTISCLVTEERNGVFELVLKYPINGSKYSEIEKDRIIKAKSNDTSDLQAFRIYRISTPINGTITVYAQHISYDLGTIGIVPFSISGVAGLTAIRQILNHAVITHPFTPESDYSSVKDISFNKPISVRSCLGGTEGSILDLWGGEFEFDNFTIKHHQHRGQDNGVVIQYGKNLTKFDKDSSISDVYTDLFPYAINTDNEGNETIVKLTEYLIPITSSITTRKTFIKDFTSFFESGTNITEDMLREVANDYLEDNPLGVETPSITVGFEHLWKQPEYAHLIERISLCDTVTIKHTKLGISTKSKVIKTVYDSILERYQSITLGTCKSNMIDKISEIDSNSKKVNKEIEELPTRMDVAIKTATEKITGNKGGYVVLHKNTTTGQPYELLIMDNPDITQAVNVWRWNVDGLGFSNNGYNGPYGTAITSDGSIVADFITSGIVDAAYIDCAGVINATEAQIKSITTDQLEAGDIVVKGEIYAQTGVFEGDLTVDSDTTSEIKNLKVKNLEVETQLAADKIISNGVRVDGELETEKLKIKSMEIAEVESTSPTITKRYFEPHGNVISNFKYFIFTASVYSFADASHRVSASVPEDTKVNVTVSAEIITPDGRAQLSKSLSCIIPAGSSSKSTTTKLISLFDQFSIGVVTFSANISSKEYSTPGTSALGTKVDFLPFNDNRYILGDASHRWKDVYSMNSACNTSDKRLKKDIDYDISKYDFLFDKLKPVSFKFVDGDSGRTHLGFISQDIKEALDESGISTNDFAAYVKAIKRESVEKDEKTEDDYVYGIRYGELHALEVYEIQLLKQQIKILESRIKFLEEKEINDG